MLIHVFATQQFEVFKGCYFLCYCLKRAENHTNCSNQPTFQLLNLIWAWLWWHLWECNNDVSKESPIHYCIMFSWNQWGRAIIQIAPLLLVCMWSHGGHVGAQKQRYFSPLGTKRHFHVNSSRKNSIAFISNMAALSRGCKPRMNDVNYLIWRKWDIILLLPYIPCKLVTFPIKSDEITNKNIKSNKSHIKG